MSNFLNIELKIDVDVASYLLLRNITFDVTYCLFDKGLINGDALVLEEAEFVLNLVNGRVTHPIESCFYHECLIHVEPVFIEDHAYLNSCGGVSWGMNHVIHIDIIRLPSLWTSL